jgi:Arc/MetJ-type ribon-helix-helix transcriptional regulator
MPIVLTSDQQTVVRQLAATGQYAGEGQVLDEALELLRQRDDLRSRLSAGIDQLDRGERIPIEEVMDGIRDRMPRS